jgi:hypothetical protein
MRLKLDELAQVVRKTVDEEKAASAFKTEIGRVFGVTVITEGKLSDVVAAANDRLDVLERTGRRGVLETFEPALTASFLDYRDPEVRKFAARVCPEKFLPKMASDKHPAVRAAVAARLSLPAVREMMRRFPQDDQLRVIFKQKKALHEAGLPKPEVQPLGIDPVAGKERLGDTVKQAEGPELTENWYNQLALKMLHDYGRNIEYAWEELAVNRYCRSAKATSGIEIDEAKLLKHIKKLIEEKEDDAMERSALKETLAWLDAQEEQENLAEDLLPDLSEDVDLVRDLMHGGMAGQQFLEVASKLFRVQHSTLPIGIRKYRLGEGNAHQTLVPCIAMLPHQHGFRAIDERALDTYCEAWTRIQSLAGEPLRLGWDAHPTDVNKISFSVVLK